LYNPQCIQKKVYIIGCTTRNIKCVKNIIADYTICNVFIYLFFSFIVVCATLKVKKNSEKKYESQLPLMKVIFVFFSKLK